MTSKFFFIANNLALDLVNTLAADSDGKEVELLGSFSDLLDWALEAAVITKSHATHLRGSYDVEQQAMLHQRTVALRSKLKAMAGAITENKPVPPSSIDSINEVLAEKEGHFEVIRTRAGYGKQFRADAGPATDILVRVAESAANLLCDGDLGLVRKCENPTCVLFFYDTSKRHGRRWCSMAGCGNRAKAKAFYQRRSAASQRRGEQNQ